MRTFKALVVESGEPYQVNLRRASETELPAGEVLVEVHYSSLNYKDGLAVTGKGKIIRQFPMVPGIDFAGVVAESSSPEYQPGDQVVLTGWGVGERYWGGYAQYARVKADWLIPLPRGLTLLHAMGIGTAGFTAMLSVMALEAHRTSKEKDVAVTGAAGGVGSIAVALLSRLGYRVVASTGRVEEKQYLESLGAAEIVGRELFSAVSRPMESERFGGAVDTVGGATLAGVLARMAYGGAVAACGLAGGSELHTTVFPFILRGVNLLGIDSVSCPKPVRLKAWERLAQVLPAYLLEKAITVAPLEKVPELSASILEGKVRGRVVVDLSA